MLVSPEAIPCHITDLMVGDHARIPHAGRAEDSSALHKVPPSGGGAERIVCVISVSGRRTLFVSSIGVRSISFTGSGDEQPACPAAGVGLLSKGPIGHPVPDTG